MSQGIGLTNHDDRKWEDPSFFAVGDDVFYDLVATTSECKVHVWSKPDDIKHIRPTDFVALREAMTKNPLIQECHFDVVDVLEKNPSVWLYWSY